MAITFDDVGGLVGKVVLYLGSVTMVSAGIAYLAKKGFEKWIDSYFAQRQKAFEHEQAKELQRLKVKIDTVVQGALKMQEREFKIIPEAWEKVSDAFGRVAWLTNPFQSYAELRLMSTAELDEF